MKNIESAYNNSVNASTGVAPNEVHMGRLLRPPRSVFDPPNIDDHQNLDHDHLAYRDLATERQQSAYRLVRELHTITASRLARRNSPIMDALHLSPPYAVGGWAWVYNSTATIRQGAKKDTDTTVLETKLSLNWIGPFNILVVVSAPASDTPDNGPLHDKLLFLDLPSDLTRRYSKLRVAIERCKPCRKPDETDDMPEYLPSDLTQYVLSSFSTKSLPFHTTLDDVSPPPERLEVDKSTGHQLVRGRGGIIAVLYEPRWVGLLSPSWERELDPQDSRRHILLYWSATPSQHRQENRLYRQMRTGATQRELSRSQGQIFLAPGYTLVPRDVWFRTFSSTVLLPGAYLWYKARNGGGWGRSPIALPRTPRTAPTSSGSSTTLHRSRSTSGRQVIQLPAPPTAVRGAYNAVRLGV